MGIFNSSTNNSSSNKIVSSKLSNDKNNHKENQIKSNFLDDTNIKSIYFENTFNSYKFEDNGERKDQLIIIKNCVTCTEIDHKKEESKNKVNREMFLKERRKDTFIENYRYSPNSLLKEQSMNEKLSKEKDSFKNKSKMNKLNDLRIENNIFQKDKFTVFNSKNNAKNVTSHKISNSISDTILPFHDIKASINDAYLLNSVMFEESILKAQKNESIDKNKLFLFNQKKS